MEVVFKNKTENEDAINCEVGTIVMLNDKNDEDFCLESFIGIIVRDVDGNKMVYDIDGDYIYTDIENYKVIKVLNGTLNIE